MSIPNYNSTARSLALPVPTVDRPPSRPSIHPPWSRRSSSVRPRSSRSARSSYRSQAARNITKLRHRIIRQIRKLPWWQRVLAVLAGIIVLVLGILFLIFNERIFGLLEPYAEKWKRLPGGFMILWAFVFFVSFPPLVGYSTFVTTAGFVYGVWEGWLIVATGTVIGSTCSFIVSRTLLSSYVHRLTANDKRFAALSLTLKHDGLKLLVMIRLCPLPYSFSNGALSTIRTVHPLAFAVATSFVTPKLLIHVFVGSRLAEIARTGEKMDTSTKAINYCSIIFGLILGVVTGWLIYGRTVARARELEAQETENIRRAAAQGISPAQFTDDPEEQTAAETLIGEEENGGGIFSNDGEDDADDDTRREDYHDSEAFTDDEDVFKSGDADIGDEEEVIGLGKRPESKEERK